MGRRVVARIHREFAEHLYAKGDYAGAAEQFVLTIGELPPSSVIASLLKAQRIVELTTYLHALHKEAAGLAAPEHTALLLHCLCKLGDADGVESFVRWASDGHRHASFGSAHTTAAVLLPNGEVPV